MATPGYQLAEVYVMRRLHKQKMKRKEEEEEEEARAKTKDVGFAVKKSSGCFPSIFNKVHPGHASTLDHVRNQVHDHDKKNKADALLWLLAKVISMEVGTIPEQRIRLGCFRRDPLCRGLKAGAQCLAKE
ncbi:hypothetical protein V6N13_001888 [Hibiscus sabdariffa]|uniref:Uncharacterized protein n=1 Tax=Hibiscus sabdariffa TaxID=183260 RepID=A0ABR2G9V3_9ROSI